MAALYFTKSLTKVLDTVWTHKAYTGSCYVELAEMIFKVTGTMIPGPTIDRDSKEERSNGKWTGSASY